MTIRPLRQEDLPYAATMMTEVYCGEPWQDQWTAETAERCLREFYIAPGFIGYINEENAVLRGALFAHRRTWWYGEELFIDELFVSRSCQGQGIGRLLLRQAEDYCQAEGLGGLVLLTRNDMPARQFYEKQGYIAAERVICLYKDM